MCTAAIREYLGYQWPDIKITLLLHKIYNQYQDSGSTLHYGQTFWNHCISETSWSWAVPRSTDPKLLIRRYSSVCLKNCKIFYISLNRRQIFFSHNFSKQKIVWLQQFLSYVCHIWMPILIKVCKIPSGVLILIDILSVVWKVF